MLSMTSEGVMLSMTYGSAGRTLRPRRGTPCPFTPGFLVKGTGVSGVSGGGPQRPSRTSGGGSQP